MTLFLIFFLLCSLLFAFSSPPLPLLHPTFTAGLSVSVSVCVLDVRFLLVWCPLLPPPAAVASPAVEAGRAGRDFPPVHTSACNHTVSSAPSSGQIRSWVRRWAGLVDPWAGGLTASVMSCPRSLQMSCICDKRCASIYTICGVFASLGSSLFCLIFASSDLFSDMLVFNWPLVVTCFALLRPQTVPPLSSGLWHSPQSSRRSARVLCPQGSAAPPLGWLHVLSQGAGEVIVWSSVV